MGRKAYLYKRASANSGEATHVFAKTPVGFMNWLAGAFGAPLEIDLKDYRLNNNVFKTASAVSENEITYIIDAEIADGLAVYFRAYWVISGKRVSNMTVFELKIDEWGTNIYNAEITHIHVTRCNRNIAIGEYDSVPMSYVDKTASILPFGSEQYTVSNVVAVVTCYAVTNIVEDGRGVKSETKQTFTLAVELNDIASILDKDASHNARGDSIIEATTRFISCVYGVVGAGTGSRDFLDCKIGNIYFLPITAVNYNLDYVTLKTKNPYSPYDEQTIRGFIVKSDVRRIYKPIGDIDVDYIYFVGSDGNATPMKRYTKEEEICFVYSISQTVSVTLSQGAESFDITKAIEAPIIGNANELDSKQLQSRQLSAFFDSITQVLKTISAGLSGNELKALTGISQFASSYLSVFDNRPQAEAITGRGDALTSYSRGIERQGKYNPNISNPFVFLRYKSLRNEKLHAYIEGAKFDYYADAVGFAGMANAPHLGEDSTHRFTTDTFIVCDADIEGLQHSARDYIDSELKRGIYYVVVND